MLFTRWIGVFLAVLGIVGWWGLTGPVRTAGVSSAAREGGVPAAKQPAPETDWMEEASQELASVGWALSLRK